MRDEHQGARAPRLRPEIPLADGLRRLNEWYAAEGVTADDLLTEECVHNWVGDEVAATGRRRDVAGRAVPRA